MTSLPYESEVLSVLLIPFLVDPGQRGPDERGLAVEIFDIATQMWPAPSYQVNNTFPRSGNYLIRFAERNRPRFVVL